jgi:hypothetical protein
MKEVFRTSKDYHAVVIKIRAAEIQRKGLRLHDVQRGVT